MGKKTIPQYVNETLKKKKMENKRDKNLVQHE